MKKRGGQVRLKTEDGIIMAPVVCLELHDKARLKVKPELVLRQHWYPSNCGTQAELAVKQQCYLCLLMDVLMLITRAVPALSEIKGILALSPGQFAVPMDTVSWHDKN